MFSNTTDTKALFRLLTPPSSYLELTTGTGIITESYARASIAQIIGAGEERTSIFAIAGELSIDPRAVERLLPAEEGWGRVGASAIVRPEEFLRLKSQLETEIAGGVVDTREFCAKVKIDKELLWRLLPPGEGEWSWLGEDTVALYGRAYYERTKSIAGDRLKEATAPLELLSLDPNAPVAFLRKVVADLLKAGDISGFLDGAKYVPDVYVQARQAALVEELQADGVIAVEALRRERVTDPKGFIMQHVPGARLLVNHCVTPEFVSQTQSLVARRVETNGWSAVTDSEKPLPSEDEKVLRQILLKAIPRVHEVAGLIVSDGLEAELQAKSDEVARGKAENAWKRRGSGRPADPTTKAQEICRITASEKSLTPTLLSHFSSSLTAYAKSQYEQRYAEMRQAWMDSARTAFLDKYHIRFNIYLEGLESIKDASLKSKLAVDLAEFARENGLIAVEKLEVALLEDPNVNLQPLQDFRSALQKTSTGRPEGYLKDIDSALHKLKPESPIEDLLTKKKSTMMQEINTQLQGSNDLSLTLLSTLLLLLAANSGGVIKATGKYVPKLLKEVQNAGIATEAQIAAMSRIKAAAVGKGDVSDADTAELKSIGQRCVGEGC